MAEPEIAQKSPYIHKVEEDGKLAWCSCGKSQKQPFCDGAHKGGEFKPMIMDVKAGETIAFCGCKRTGNAPRCDGAHSKLS
jgi:CDGSH-type Zn-finger protein